MMTSTDGEPRRVVPGLLIAFGAGLVGVLVALGLGLLTFGVQATVDPRHLPLAVGTVDAGASPAVAQIARRVATQGGDRVDWHTVNSRAEAERLLDQKQIYGALLFSAGSGGVRATVVVSGALNPNATQIAQPILVQVGDGIARAAPVQVVTVRPTSAAGRTLPLAAGTLLWLAALICNVLVVAVAPTLRGGRSLGRLATLGAAVTAAALGTGMVRGLAWVWDSGLPIGWDVIEFIALVAASFALLQAGLLRWLGMAGMGLLAPLYLMAPAIAGLPPEILNPVYRAALWSWTPFRFAAEGLRSLIFLSGGAPDVQNAVRVFAGIGLAGLLLTLAPKPHRRRAETSEPCAAPR